MTANVLIVDDLEPNIRLLEAKLLSEYYTVFATNSGIKAIEILKKEKIDVILLDVMMPQMDGFETCRRIKENPDTTHIPVVMVTALTEIEDRIKGLEAGADEFLTKPINDVALFARVKSLSRIKIMIDELKIRNQTNINLGISEIDINHNFENNKILLINDDIVQGRNINKMLLKLTPQIKIFNSLDKLDEFNDYIPDLVIISCQLEETDPLRATVMIKSKENLRHSIVMLFAEEENIQMVIKGMELGVNDYFIYPVDENELIARVKTQLRRKLYQDNLRNQLEQSISLSITDGLTGVYNRRYFDSHIKQMTDIAKDQKKSLILLMLDIDHFKKVNDNYGHQAGDTVLKIFVNTLKNVIRVTDLIARYGGEEFAIILSDLTIEEAMQIAERGRQLIEETKIKISDDLILNITASIGIATYKYDDIQAFITSADKALYQAKEQGRNRVVISIV